MCVVPFAYFLSSFQEHTQTLPWDHLCSFKIILPWAKISDAKMLELEGSGWRDDLRGSSQPPGEWD